MSDTDVENPVVQDLRGVAGVDVDLERREVFITEGFEKGVARFESESVALRRYIGYGAGYSEVTGLTELCHLSWGKSRIRSIEPYIEAHTDGLAPEIEGGRGDPSKFVRGRVEPVWVGWSVVDLRAESDGKFSRI